MQYWITFAFVVAIALIWNAFDNYMYRRENDFDSKRKKRKNS